ncbi:MAG TPA: TIGR00730 family Rossman fold protein [Stellaceae bacterium]|nr:TIGR00730 family Rossman fold protein [Stellaceae bacterium]
MQPIRRVCVYCGSSAAVAPRFRQAVSELGRALAEAGIAVIYGGGRVGLMGLLADAALAVGGTVTGIIPAHLTAGEAAHQGLTELVVVDSLHARKREMAARADAFAVLPGGIGTLDETFEILSWKQLALHRKPILILDAAGYWAPLRALLDHVVTHGFARPQTLDLVRIVADVSALMTALAEVPASLTSPVTDRL